MNVKGAWVDANLGAGGTAMVSRHSLLRGDLRGITAVEYGIVAAFLCLSLLAIFSKFGGVLTSMFSTATNGI